jgi:hypothetical protein
MDRAHLQLALFPVLPGRTPPQRSERLGYGYALRLVDGPALEDADPLLDAFGAQIDRVAPDSDDDRVLQSEAFAPGRRLRLLPEPLRDDAIDEVGVWDYDGVSRAGTIAGSTASRVCAALDHGLTLAAIALWEERSVVDDRRVRLKVLVYAPQFVSVADAPPPALPRTSRPTRRRLVLFADDGGDLRWWDPGAAGGPVDTHSLPVSDELGLALSRLRKGYERLRGTDDDVEGGFDQLEHTWQRESLDEQAHALWLRARTELGRRFVIGFLGRGMERPQWSPSVDVEDDDIPF